MTYRKASKVLFEIAAAPAVRTSRFLRLLLLLLLASLACGSSAAVASPARFEGFFGGGYGSPGAFTYTQIELEQREGGLSGKIYQPNNRTDTPRIKKIEAAGNRIRFVAGELAFDLWRTQTGFQGTVRAPRGETLPAFFAIRPGSPPAGLLRRFEGTYHLANGRLITLSRNNDGGGFWYLELPSGRTGFLFNLSDTEFLAGPCLYCAGPEYLRLRFHPGSGTSPVSRVSARIGGKEFIAERTRAYREQQVSFTAKDGKRLAGSLYLPVRPAKHPAIVLVHGSGGQTRNGFFGHLRFLAEAYARSGIAVLAYDKRGMGGSGGNYDTAGFATLADDAAAALRYLATRRDIQRDRLGLSGASQAGWLVPMAATRFPHASILQIRVGSAPMGVEESERRRLVRQMQADGFTTEDIATALHVRTLMDSYARTGAGWDGLAAAAEPVKNEYWMQKYIGALPPRDSTDWPWLKEAFSYDVRSDFARYRGRWQILYGGGDALIDPAVVIPMVRSALEEGHPLEVDIEVLPNATHNGLLGKTGGEKEFPGLSQFVPGYFDKIVNWAARRLR